MSRAVVYEAVEVLIGSNRERSNEKGYSVIPVDVTRVYTRTINVPHARNLSMCSFNL